MTRENTNLQLLTTFNLENLIFEATCFKGLSSCTDLTITNGKSYFKNTCVATTGMSDFDKLTAATLKSQVLRAAAKCKFYTNYKNFDDYNFNKA